MSPIARAGCATLYATIGVVMGVGLASPDLAVEYRIICVLGVGSALFSLRAVLGRVLIVGSDGLVIQRYWPVRRFIAWYRIELVDVLPGFWNLELQLNSGERVELPPVDDLDGLYRTVEDRRSHLDA